MEKYARISDATWEALTSNYPVLNRINKTEVDAGRISFQTAIARAGEMICYTTFPGTSTPLPVAGETSKYVKKWITEATWDDKKQKRPGTYAVDQFDSAETIFQIWIRSGFQTYRWSQCYVINLLFCAILGRLGWHARLVKGNGTPSDTNGNGSIDLMVSGPKFTLDSVAMSDRTHTALYSDQAPFRRYFLSREDFMWNVHYWMEVEHNNEVWIVDGTPTITLSENGTYVYGPCRRESIHNRRSRSGDVSFARLSAIFNSAIKKWAVAGDIIYPVSFQSNRCNGIMVVGGSNVSQYYRSQDYVPAENEVERSLSRKYYFKVVNGRLAQIVSETEEFTRTFPDEVVYVASFDQSGANVAQVKGRIKPLECEVITS